MNSKGHLFISIVKSIIRISSCFFTFVTQNVSILAIGFFLAEILGLLEEFVDNR